MKLRWAGAPVSEGGGAHPSLVQKAGPLNSTAPLFDGAGVTAELGAESSHPESCQPDQNGHSFSG